MFRLFSKNKQQRAKAKREKLADKFQKMIPMFINYKNQQLLSNMMYNHFIKSVSKKIGKVSNSSNRQKLNILMRKIKNDPKNINPDKAGKEIHDLILQIPVKK